MTQSLDFQQQLTHKLERFKEFVFVSDSALKSASEPKLELQCSADCSGLDRIVVGDYIIVKQLCTPRSVTRQLQSYKFEPEQQVQLLSRTNTGSVIVRLNNTLVGIGAEIARRIIVSWVGK